MTRKDLIDKLQFMLDWAHGARERHGVDEVEETGLVIERRAIGEQAAAGQLLTISPRVGRLIIEYLKEQDQNERT